MKTRLTWIAAVLTLLAVAGCGEGEDYGVQSRVQLQRFNSCGAATTTLRKMAIQKMEAAVDDALERRKKYNYGGIQDAGMAMADAGAAPTQPSTPTKKDEPAAHTTTNTQEDNVDEPDFIKNDGTRMFVLSGTKLFVAETWPASAMKLVATLPLSGKPTNMFLDGTRIVVFSAASVSSGFSATRMTVLDVSQLDTPKVVSTWTVAGAYVSARRVGSVVRLVLRGTVKYPGGVSTYLSVPWGASEGEMEMAAAKLKSDNRRLINQAPLSDWIPHGSVQLPDGTMVEMGVDCNNIYAPNAPVDLGLTSVVSLDLDKPKTAPNTTTVLGKADTIYASAKSLYLAAAHYWYRSIPGQTDHIYLHKFDITKPNRATYVASGGMDGKLVNQFAMSEHKGYLRVATTTTLQDPQSSWRTITSSHVSVLAEKAGFLTEVGRTKELAEGERIFSVRFNGDRGFVVTFRQTDPLFTVDLSNPRNPKVVGELKVPGFSTYMHPIDQNHILTIGATSGSLSWSRGVKLTIFDVSDLANPKEKFTRKVGGSGSKSEANQTHLAFTYFAQRGLLAIPVLDYTYNYSTGNYWDRYINQLQVFKVDMKTGFSEVGAMDMADMHKGHGQPYYGYGTFPGVRRSVMAVSKAGEDFVYAIGNYGIRVANTKDLTRPVKTVVFN